ncbi:MAG: multiubiquitin domain-containing protein [Nitrososphaerota archaeon]|nr:multiubiquitin domain-containing protein [Nitrososphaerota archaeon]
MEFAVNDKHFVTQRAQMTGLEIREFAGLSGDHRLFCLTDGGEKAIEPGHTVAIKNGMRFKGFPSIAAFLEGPGDLGEEFARHGINSATWDRFNLLEERGLSTPALQRETQVSSVAVHFMRTVKQCIDRYDHDVEKVRACVNGEIPP